MGTQENIQVVKDAYAAFGRGDIASLLALLTEDVEWISPGTGLPLAGTYHGRSGVANFFQKLGEEGDILAFEPREFLGDGDRVVVIGWERGKVKSTGKTFEVDWVMTFKVRNGNIAKFQEHFDTQAIAIAYQSTARAAV